MFSHMVSSEAWQAFCSIGDLFVFVEKYMNFVIANQYLKMPAQFIHSKF